jgi:hypothetical protein
MADCLEWVVACMIYIQFTLFLGREIMPFLYVCFFSLLIVPELFAQNLIPNGDFERGLVEWSSLWTRDADAGQVRSDREVVHGGQRSVRIEHHGQQDWSFGTNERIHVAAGELYMLEAWVKVQGEGDAVLCVVTQDADDGVLHWSYAERRTGQTEDWVLLRSRFVVPGGCVYIRPRLIGNRPSTVWLDDVLLIREGNVADWQADVPQTVTMQNEYLSVSLDTRKVLLTVLDKRNQQEWTQRVYVEEGAIKSLKQSDRHIETDFMHFPSGIFFDLRLELQPERAEVLVTLDGAGEQTAAILFPHPFVTNAGTYLVIPMNEGISFPVDDRDAEEFRLIAYGGHGICMGFWGVTDGNAGQMAILETPDDAAIRMKRIAERLCIVPEWDSQKGQFGYARKIRYVFFDQGGHVAIAKRYREHAKQQGLLKTLKQKRAENPHVDLLVGAVNVWNWDGDPIVQIQAMKSQGIERILWSRRSTPEQITAMNEMEFVLSSRYDIFQDSMNPENFPKLNWIHADWTSEGWPDDIMLDANGHWRRGWEVKGKDGQWYPCGVLCDRQALKYACERVPQDLATHPYRSRFIDTTTASPWRECYHPDHAMTRTESKYWKMELLRYMSEEMNLVTGSETGHDAAVPYVHYFEGMMSLGPYRVPDAGRNMSQIWEEVPERVSTYQVGHAYRLPLWELVYHDCVVSQWYWGDYNNKLPSIWDKRDLFNLLYGTPPMFLYTKAFWEENKERFARSYATICPTVRRIGYEEMVDHRFLTADRGVQQTVFSDGTVITVNFSDTAHTLIGGEVVEGMGYHIGKKEWVGCCEWLHH